MSTEPGRIDLATTKLLHGLRDMARQFNVYHALGGNGNYSLACTAVADAAQELELIGALDHVVKNAPWAVVVGPDGHEILLAPGDTLRVVVNQDNGVAVPSATVQRP